MLWISKLAFALLVSMVAAPAIAAVPCTDFDALQPLILQRRLTSDHRQCLQSLVDTGTNADDRAQASFLLILDAHQNQDEDAYESRMRRHLTELHTTDREVAYLYASHLFDKDPKQWEEVIRWSQVAMEGRRDWLHNRANYNTMVRSLYEMLVEAALNAAVARKRVHESRPSDTTLGALADAQRRARYYMIVAGPCLHNGDCGPYFEVEVEGHTTCDDLAKLENYAKIGRVDEPSQSCLRSVYRQPTAQMKGRVLDILMTNADQQPTAQVWNRLLAWHWNVTGKESFPLAARFTQWLQANDQDAEQIYTWSGVGIALSNTLRGKQRDQVGGLHQLHVESAAALLEAAKLHGDDDAVTTAQSDYDTAIAAQTLWCQAESCP